MAKDANNSDEVFWLAPDTVPTLGDWFRAGGYRTFFKGKWHASHADLTVSSGCAAWGGHPTQAAFRSATG